jgi:hypothetical protein
VLVESVDANGRTMVTKPMKRGSARGIVLETMWHLGANEIQTSDPKEPHEMPWPPHPGPPNPKPTRKCIQTCVWEDDPGGRHHHIYHKIDDSGDPGN